jgi:hypothetical protein
MHGIKHGIAIMHVHKSRAQAVKMCPEANHTLVLSRWVLDTRPGLDIPSMQIADPSTYAYSANTESFIYLSKLALQKR